MHELHNDFSFLLKIIKIEKFEKLVAILHDKNEYVIQIRNLKQALSHGLSLKKFYSVIKFNQSARLQSYIKKSSMLRRKTKNDFKKYTFFKLMNNSISGITMENLKENSKTEKKLCFFL